MKLVINQKFIIIVLLLSVIILAGYVGFDEINGYLIESQNSAYIIGYNHGIEDVVSRIIQESETCGVVPVVYGNKTINMIVFIIKF